MPNLEFDQSLPRAKMSKVVIDGREFYDMNVSCHECSWYDPLCQYCI